MATEVQAPKEFPKELRKKFSIFLGGAIDMGKAEDWQKRLVNDLKDYDVVLLNPRRDDFQVDAVQSMSNPYFKEQVEWELEMQDSFSDLLVYYIPPGTQSRITLLEIGLFCRELPHVICCPEGFDRKGNIDVTSNYFNFNLVHSYVDLLEEIKARIPKKTG